MKAPQDIIIKPIITERSMDALQTGKYTFKVDKNANKIEIAEAVDSEPIVVEKLTFWQKLLRLFGLY